MTILSPNSSEYAEAVRVPGLDEACRKELVAHITRSNEVFTQRPPITQAVARCAAVLLAADPARLSCPTVLAQANALAQSPRLGPALMCLHEGLMQMDGLSEADLIGLGMHRYTFRQSLAHVAHKLTRLQQTLEAHDPSKIRRLPQ